LVDGLFPYKEEEEAAAALFPSLAGWMGTAKTDFQTTIRKLAIQPV
jgi:hypothetical protein